jgi:c-di-GMP-binding flagellar brake protein YcgR
MFKERRQHVRVAIPIDGRWLGASGGTTCQIENISLGGCFIRTSAPSVEGAGVIRFLFGSEPLSIAGRVIHAERGRGFGVKFHDVSSDVRSALERHIEERKAARVA